AGPGQVSAITFARAVANAVLGEVARRHQLRGPSSMILGTSALGYASDLLSDGAAELVLCVGIDVFTENTAWYHHRAGMLDDGLMLGEAGAALVLERASNAQARGAKARARILDYATVFCPEAVQRVTDFTSEAIRTAMEEALTRSGLSSESIEFLIS